MSQSNRIFAFLSIAFVIFITMRGELPTYISFLTGGTGTPAAGNTTGQAATNSQVASLVSEGEQLATVAAIMAV